MKTYDIIRKPILSEKTYADISNKKYAFVVDKNANKVEIKKAVEEAFGVKVKSVNTANVDGKLKVVKKKFISLRDARKWEYIINPDTIVDVSNRQLPLHKIIDECRRIVSSKPYELLKHDCQWVIGKVYNKLVPKIKKIKIITSKMKKLQHCVKELSDDNTKHFWFDASASS